MPTSLVPADDEPFHFRVDDAFTMTNRGTVVTGAIESGRLQIGDTVRLVRSDGGPTGTVVGIEFIYYGSQQRRPEAEVGLMLSTLAPEDFERGDLIVLATDDGIPAPR